MNPNRDELGRFAKKGEGEAPELPIEEGNEPLQEKEPLPMETGSEPAFPAERTDGREESAPEETRPEAEEVGGEEIPAEETAIESPGEFEEKQRRKAEKKREKKRYKRKKKGTRPHLFSRALFQENFKSHRKSLLIVSLGNASIMAIIIGILSGLHINSTSEALKDLFGNADTESTVKEGAISFYSAFSGCAEAFDTVKEGKTALSSSLSKILGMPADSATITKIDALKALYKGRYLLESGTEEEKHLASKEFAINEAKKTFTSQTPEQEQEATVLLLDAFFEEYHADSSPSTKTLLQTAITHCLGKILAANFDAPEAEAEEIALLAGELCREYYEGKADKNALIEGYVLRLLRYAAPEEHREFTVDLSASLTDAFQKDAEAYLKDESIENALLKDAIIDESVKEMESIAYLKYLPDFVVECYTSNFGYPITYVPTGEFNDNGTEKMEVIEVKVYNPDVYVYKDAKMGTNSNLVEKLHKEQITGEPYPEKTIAIAKAAAKDDLSTVKGEVESFFDDYLKRYDEYHRSGKVNDDLLTHKAVGLVKKIAADTLVKDFNATHETQISSIEEITVHNYSMDGRELMQYVDSYAASGITSYRTYRDDSASRGYTAKEAQLIAVARGSLGVIDQLPSSIQESLNEMGGMNTYGIIVGVIAFGIAVLLIPMVYTILTANSLVAEKVESGSLAFTMSTPISRQSFIFTSGVYLVFSEVFMALSLLAVSVLAQVIGGYFGSGDLLASLPLTDICAYALGNFMVSLAISGICFMSSCWHNKTNDNIGVSGGISIFFFICAILGLFATKAIPGTIRIETMDVFNYVTIFSLFDSLAVMDGNWTLFFLKLLGLLGIAVVTYIAGSVKFTKKDLPL